MSGNRIKHAGRKALSGNRMQTQREGSFVRQQGVFMQGGQLCHAMKCRHAGRKAWSGNRLQAPSPSRSLSFGMTIKVSTDVRSASMASAACTPYVESLTAIRILASLKTMLFIQYYKPHKTSKRGQPHLCVLLLLSATGCFSNMAF